jgi:Tol biopolymer transport system component
MKQFTLWLIFGTVLWGGDQPAVEVLGSPVPLTAPGETYIAPEWSPTGEALAFTGPQYQGVYVYSLATNTTTTLAVDPAAGYGMSWSHDGTKIAIRVARFEQRRRWNALAVLDVVTGNKRVLTDFTTTLPGVPRWTAGDRRIFFSEVEHLTFYSVEESAPPPVAEPIFYARRNQVVAFNPATGEERIIGTWSGPVLNLAVAPTGEKIAFEVLGGDLWVVNRDGSQALDLGPGNEPSWHPDGTRLAYMITIDDGHQILNSDIYVVRADGTGKVNLTATPEVREMRPAWSPDGRWIAYDTYDRGQILLQEVR